MSADSEADAELWRRRVAEAARLAAEDLGKEDDPQLRWLYADLKDLEGRMTSDQNEPNEAGEPRGKAD